MPLAGQVLLNQPGAWDPHTVPTILFQQLLLTLLSTHHVIQCKDSPHWTLSGSSAGPLLPLSLTELHFGIHFFLFHLHLKNFYPSFCAQVKCYPFEPGRFQGDLFAFFYLPSCSVFIPLLWNFTCIHSAF